MKILKLGSTDRVHGPNPVGLGPRVSAWEFFGHNVRESAGKRLIFCMLVEMLVTHNI